jgi:hypothetical protein
MVDSGLREFEQAGWEDPGVVKKWNSFWNIDCFESRKDNHARQAPLLPDQKYVAYGWPTSECIFPIMQGVALASGCASFEIVGHNFVTSAIFWLPNILFANAKTEAPAR